MRSAPTIVVALAALGAAVGTRASGGPQDFATLERGRYLVTVADCGSCHTVPGSDHAFAGGRPIETPFGTLAAPNITPDRETGIGAWTDDEFDFCSPAWPQPKRRASLSSHALSLLQPDVA